MLEKLSYSYLLKREIPHLVSLMAAASIPGGASTQPVGDWEVPIFTATLYLETSWCEVGPSLSTSQDHFKMRCATLSICGTGAHT